MVKKSVMLLLLGLCLSSCTKKILELEPVFGQQVNFKCYNYNNHGYNYCNGLLPSLRNKATPITSDKLEFRLYNLFVLEEGLSQWLEVSSKQYPFKAAFSSDELAHLKYYLALFTTDSCTYMSSYSLSLVESSGHYEFDNQEYLPLELSTTNMEISKPYFLVVMLYSPISGLSEFASASCFYLNLIDGYLTSYSQLFLG